MRRLFRLLTILLESYILIGTLALLGGLFFPDTARVFTPWVTFLLQIIFFLSSLKIELRAVLVAIRDLRFLGITTLYMLVVLPIIVYGVAQFLVPDLAIALTLLATMPAAMSAPLFAEVVGLTTSLALTVTVITSLITPITVPFVMWLLVGSTIRVDALGMFWSLTSVVILPFALAQIVRAVWPTGIRMTQFSLKPLSLILLGLLIAGVVAPLAPTLRLGLTSTLLSTTLILFIFFIALHIAGYFIVFWKGPTERLTTSLCLTYMNFTLAIYLAGTFFNTPNVVLPVTLSVLPWTLLLLPFRSIARWWCRDCFVHPKDAF